MAKEYVRSKLIYNPKRKTFDEPDPEQMDCLVKQYPDISEEDANDPRKEMDNRIFMRYFYGGSISVFIKNQQTQPGQARSNSSHFSL
jgi:hypothetical protein